MNTNSENRETWAEFVARLGIEVRTRRYKPSAARRAEWGEGARHFRVELMRPDSACICVSFSQGSARTTAPTAEEVLDALAADSATVENTGNFENWCGELGYDTDSRKAHATWTACLQQRDLLRVFLAGEYENALWRTEAL